MSDFDALQDEIARFVDERDWARFHDPKSVLLALVGEVGELAEILQWVPADRAAELARQPPHDGELADEIADVLIYLSILARSVGIDLVPAARAKVARNHDRFPAQPG